MEPEPAQPGLFWLAAVLVLLVIVMVLAKPLLGVRRPTRD